MTYITIKQSPAYRQMSLEEFLFSSEYKSCLINSNISNTKTYSVERVSDRVLRRVDVFALISVLTKFNHEFRHLRDVPRDSLYYTFYIPKKTHGLRRIDAPNDDLMNALRVLKRIFEDDFGALYHTSSFAYVKHRCTVDAVRKHQQNESKWFAKYDLSNFFGSTTLEFTLDMFSKVFPFSELFKYTQGREMLKEALELCFLNGGLPQGTPISPLITNIMMIPIDYTLNKAFRNYQLEDGTVQRFIYTRYADDFIVSSRYDFDFRKIEDYMKSVLSSFNAPFTIKEEKTRYGSSSGSNWNLGVMLNKDNEITVGAKRKREFTAMLSNYVMDKKNGTSWDVHDIQVMEGYRNYYKMVEGKSIDDIISKINRKYSVDVESMIKEDLS